MKKIFTYLILLLVTHAAWAQPEPTDEKLEALRIAFLTKQLDLNPEEAQRFWPVYNAYTGDVKRLNMDLRTGKLSQLEFEEKMLDLRKGFKPKFSKAVGEDKFERFLKADREWRDLLRREIEKRRQNMKQRRGLQVP